MIDVRPLKEQAEEQFPELIRSVIQMQKDFMREEDIVDFFINLRKKARELDAKQKKEKE